MPKELNAVELIQALSDQQVRFFVIGGFAAVLHGCDYVTKDLDVCAAMTEDNVVRILKALADLDPRVRGRPDRMRLPMEIERWRGAKNIYVDTRWGYLDLLGEIPAFGSFEAFEPRTISALVGRSECKILDIDTLIEIKNKIGRPKDRLVASELEAIRAYRRSSGELA